MPASTKVAAKAFCTQVESRVTQRERHAIAAVFFSTTGKLRTFAAAAASKSLLAVSLARPPVFFFFFRADLQTVHTQTRKDRRLARNTPFSVAEKRLAKPVQKRAYPVR